MVIWQTIKKQVNKSSNKPHIFIDSRSRLHFNKAYIDKAASLAFEVYLENNLIHFNHDSITPDISIIRKNKVVYNKAFGDWLRSLAGNDITPEFDLYGCCTIKMIQVKKLQTININGTEYSVTSAKNYINTLKSRIEKSKTNKSKADNKQRYLQILAKAKAAFPNEFAKY